MFTRGETQSGFAVTDQNGTKKEINKPLNMGLLPESLHPTKCVRQWRTGPP